MFTARVKKASQFRVVIDAIKDLCSDVCFECGENGIYLQAMDPSHVSMVEMFLDAQSFETYECSQPTTFGINLMNLSKILKFGTSQDSLLLSLKETCLQMTFVNEKETMECVFELNLMELENDELALPELNYTAQVSMSSNEFQKTIRELKDIGDVCIFEVNSDKKSIQMQVSGETTKGNVHLKSSDTTEIQTTCSFRQGYSMKYLNQFTKGFTLTTRVKICLSVNLPLMVKYLVSFQDNDSTMDLTPSNGHLSYYLAPKVNHED